ncbi:MAG: helix-turn-helix transcriptional regulator [Bacteroidetes bacterium]|nr:helix-turn-helix transcriptional regulator [Bacteroidota bacterium]
MLSKFIESLHVRFSTANFREIVKPFIVKSKVDKSNTIVMVNRGHLRMNDESEFAPEGSFYFIPAGRKMSVSHGLNPEVEFNSYTQILEIEGQEYLKAVTSKDQLENVKELLTFVRFDVELFDIIPFFSSLDLPIFHIEPNEELSFLLKRIAIEQESKRLGYNNIITNYMGELLIYICRYIEAQPDLQQYLTKLEFLADKRLVDIVKYVGENLDKDLSNKTIASIAFISEDYVGQFFKSLTKKNLQDYIENQRLEMAMRLLKTIPDNIQEIAHKVGFKDPAYFSRRFKLRYGINANSVRR